MAIAWVGAGVDEAAARTPLVVGREGLRVTFDHATPVRLEAVPLALDYCYTRQADADEAAWIGRRVHAACAALGTRVTEHAGRLVVDLAAAGSPRSPEPAPAGRALPAERGQ